MIKLKINKIAVEAQQGSTILSEAKKLNIDIPTMCYMDSYPHITSCMVCMVRDNKTGKLVPACSTPVSEDMDIETDSDIVHKIRRDALELMLSEHVGDCEAPCQNLCPAHMNIPLMTRQIAKGEFTAALKTVKNDIALPSVLGYICPAPCEKGCRRGSVDSPVSICLLKRFVGEKDITETNSYLPEIGKSTGKKIAVIGSGPAGLAAAYHLQIKGHHCDVYDKNELPGGTLRYSKMDSEFPISALDNEIDLIKKTGVVFIQKKTIDDEALIKLQQIYNAIVLTSGTVNDNERLKSISYGKNGIEITHTNYTTNIKGVFAGGNAVRDGKMAVRSVGQGKEIAFSVDQYLTNLPVTGEPRRFNSKFGKLNKIEFDQYLKDATSIGRINLQNKLEGFTPDQAIREAERCMHCDCRKPDNCKLRDYSEQYGASQRKYQINSRSWVSRDIQTNFLVYESAKCIKCGICVQITQQKKEKIGFTFIGRGFNVKVDAPFSKHLEEALQHTATECANSCPTGALSLIKKNNQ